MARTPRTRKKSDVDDISPKKTEQQKKTKAPEIDVDQLVEKVLDTVAARSQKSPKDTEIDVDQLVERVLDTVTTRIKAEVEGKLSVALDKINKSLEVKRESLILTGKHQYIIQSDMDGLSFSRDKELGLLLGKNGQLSTGTKNPRTVGKGSLHIKAGYSSEALIPSNGLGSTRGLLVEGDGDDEKTFAFRAVSRMNRQGTNIFSDGSMSLGSMKKVKNSTMGVYHRHNDTPALGIVSPTMSLESDLVTINTAAPKSRIWNALRISADHNESFDYQTDIFKVTGHGNVFADTGYYSNLSGYAEMFEWADQNHRKESRVGFTVALNQEGKLVIADEGDNAIGVVVPDAAFVGNAAWNDWHEKFVKSEDYSNMKRQYSVVEWLENETTTVKSYDLDTLPQNFAMPENATEIQTDQNGDHLEQNVLNHDYRPLQKYLPRQDRHEWACVCIVGMVPVYKGQILNNNWIQVKDISDELELIILK